MSYPDRQFNFALEPAEDALTAQQAEIDVAWDAIHQAGWPYGSVQQRVDVRTHRRTLVIPVGPTLHPDDVVLFEAAWEWTPSGHVLRSRWLVDAIPAPPATAASPRARGA